MSEDIANFLQVGKESRYSALAATGEHTALRELQALENRRSIICDTGWNGEQVCYDPDGVWDKRGIRRGSGSKSPSRYKVDSLFIELLGYEPPSYVRDRVLNSAKRSLRLERQNIIARELFIDALKKQAKKASKMRMHMPA